MLRWTFLIYLGLISTALAQSPQAPATQFSIRIDGAIASRAPLITGKAGQGIYVTALMLAPAATANVILSYGSGTNCATNNVVIWGSATGITFPTAQVFSYGDGYGAIFVVPSGGAAVANDLCIATTTAVAPGSIAYAQF